MSDYYAPVSDLATLRILLEFAPEATYPAAKELGVSIGEFRNVMQADPALLKSFLYRYSRNSDGTPVAAPWPPREGSNPEPPDSKVNGTFLPWRI